MFISALIRIFMGLIKKILKLTAVIALCLVILSLLPNLPPYIEYNAYNVTPPVPLKGALGLNTLLNNAERLYEGALKGPEAFEVYNGVLYTGLHGGEIVKFVDGKIIPVAKFGLPCEGFWEEKKCGRPLGMKFGPDGYLYVADAYYGLYKLDVNSGSKVRLISANDIIEGKPVKLPNSVDVANDGTIYWTISSTDFHLEDGVFDMLADGSGRLLKFDPKTKVNKVLIDNLHFANGVILSSNEDFVLVAETVRSRIHRYYLKGPKKGVHDIFLDGLPGVPDNIKSDGGNGFFISLVLGRDSSNPILFQSLGPFPSVRKAISRFIALLELFFQQIDASYPNYYTKRAIHYIGHFESLHGIGSKRVTILHVDEDGKIKGSYHCTNGKVLGISEIQWFEGAFYLGSPYNNYVGRVVLEHPEVASHEKRSVKEDTILKKQVHDQEQPKKAGEQEQRKQSFSEKKPAVQPKHTAQESKVPMEDSSKLHQEKQPLKMEKKTEKQPNQGKKDQDKPQVQQRPADDPKPAVSQQKKQPQRPAEVPKPAVPQQKKQPQRPAEVPKPAVPQQKQQQPQKPAEVPKPAVPQQKQQQPQKPAEEVPKPAVPQQKQQQPQKSSEVPKPAVPQQKQQQPQKSSEVPKPAVPQQKQQQTQKSSEVPKPAVPQQKQQQPQKSAEVPKPASPQQKQQQPQRPTEVPKPAAPQQKQQQAQRSAEVPKPAVPQQKQQQAQQSAEVPKPAAPQHIKEQKFETTDKQSEIRKEKPTTEQKTVPQLKESQVPQKKPVKEQTFPAQQQKPYTQEKKPQMQQQKLPAKEERPVVDKSDKPAVQQHKNQKAGNQQETTKIPKASVPQPSSHAQREKPSLQQEKPSSQPEQQSQTTNQKAAVQDKKIVKEQQPPK